VRRRPRPGPGRGEVGGGREVKKPGPVFQRQVGGSPHEGLRVEGELGGVRRTARIRAHGRRHRMPGDLFPPTTASRRRSDSCRRSGRVELDDAQPSSVVVDRGARPSALQERGLRKSAPLRSARSRVAYQMCASLSVAQMCPSEVDAWRSSRRALIGGSRRDRIRPTAAITDRNPPHSRPKRPAPVDRYLCRQPP
jgi:hypothetical protein